MSVGTDGNNRDPQDREGAGGSGFRAWYIVNYNIR